MLDRHADERPIDWERVHRLPDHVRFVHEAHLRFLTQGEPRIVTLPVGDELPLTLPMEVPQACSVCHGDVTQMTEIQPQEGQSLKNGYLPRLPPRKQRKHRLHGLPQVTN